MKKTILFALILCTSTAWAQSPKGHYDVYAIKYASVGHLTATSEWADQAPKQDSVGIEFMVWLIKGQGRNILVDAGFLNDIENAKEFGPVNYLRPDSAVIGLGVKPEEVTDVILTHPHWDHLDGLVLFPKARVWMQKADYDYFVGGSWQKGGNHGGFARRNVLMLAGVNVDGRLTLVDGDDKEIIPGIKVFTGSRHTFNSQYVLVNTGTERIVLASDNIWVYYSLEHMKPAPTFGTFDQAGYVKAMARMKTLVSKEKFIIPGHDARVFKIFTKVGDRAVKVE
jgi:glyoxylase-like metal-dependent hydrolase (beta-lactamase superfamily II)